ncbi:MAG: hypothetical protein EBX52_06715 [Proteobacteria bacterium]|nr:hypothetical protein [Pseudomonadota bacterium]
MISRIAPTPSGYLHLGNALNFVLTWLTVRRGGGRLLLRIDDLDEGLLAGLGTAALHQAGQHGRPRPHAPARQSVAALLRVPGNA